MPSSQSGSRPFRIRAFTRLIGKQPNTVEALNAIRSRAKRTWVLYTIPLHLQYEYPEVMASIQRDFKVVKQFYGSLGGGTIFVCRAETPPL